MGSERRPTVLVTGGASRIGSSVVRHLGPGCSLVFLVNRRSPPVSGPDVRMLTGGLAGVSRHVAAIQAADVVLHMAGVSHASEEGTYLEVNLRGTMALLEVCRKDQPLIYLSTRCAAPDGGAYALSKYRAEQAIAAGGQPYVIIRPSEVYGSTSGEGIDALIDLALRWRILIDFRAHREIAYSPVSCDELGRFVADVVRGDLSHAAKTYTLCNSRSYTARDIQVAIQRGLRTPIIRVPVPVRVLKAAARARLPLPFARDQIDRLVMDKPADNRSAREDYAFAPRCFLEYLESRCALEYDR